MKLKEFIRNYFPDVKFLPRQKIALNETSQVQKIRTMNDLISWPPNVFLILYSLLEYTDKYRLLVSPQPHFAWNKTDKDSTELIASQWLELIANQVGKKTQNPHKYLLLIDAIHNIFNQSNLNKCIYKLMNEPTFSKSTFHLLISIDTIFSKFNIFEYQKSANLGTALVIRELWQPKDEYNNLSDSDKKLGVVTFKTNVPQTGLTINNLTHNLTCIKPTVSPKFIRNTKGKKEFKKNKYNILFLPWPLKIDEDSFNEITSPLDDIMDDYFGFFQYSPTEELSLAPFYASIMSAIQRAGSIDIIVFPECSLDEKTFAKFSKNLLSIFKEHSPSLLAGVYDNNIEEGKNSAKLAFIGETGNFEIVEQHKHHRWFLDENQIRAYNLGAALDINKKWWENIPIKRRELLTVHTPDGVKLCPLICEDLARQEPVAQAVRAVGPNLVISLLLDGPQLPNRWPGKYSAVLSDDPGSSVLSVTALGMTLRSTGRGDKPSRTVALWSEPGKGSEPLDLAEDALGIMIELAIEKENMWTLDGRKEHKPVLRKINHSSVTYDHKMLLSSRVNFLKKELINTIKKRGSK
ncbi:hypothetical protein AB8101_000029 [Vibrio vulnificus]